MNDEMFDQIGRALAGATTRRQALKVLGGGLAGGLVVAGGVRGAAAKPKKGGKKASGDSPFTGVPVTGSDEAGNQVFAGTLDVKKFVVSDGAIYALGQVRGTVDDKKGKTHTITRGVRLPLQSINGVDVSGGEAAGSQAAAAQFACDVLTLVLGPLDLNLLGLRIQLNQVNLEITAIPGGGLLGDLLCAVVNLLNPLGSLLRIVELLNRILDLLG